MRTTEHRAKMPPAKTGLFAMLRGWLRARGSRAPSGPRRGPSLAFATTCTMLIAAAALLAGSSVSAAAEPESCPNEARRSEQGVAALALPECRAYEMVSPVGAEPFLTDITFSEGHNNLLHGVASSPDGEKLAFFSISGSSESGPYFLSKRGQAGWSTESVIPSQSKVSGDECSFATYAPAFTPDLSKGVLADGLWQPPTHNCGADEPILDPDEQQGVQNIFVRDNEQHTFELINVAPVGVKAVNAWFQAASADFSHVFFTADEEASLTPDAPSGSHIGPPGPEEENLYVMTGGDLRFVTYLPDGTPTPGFLANGSQPNDEMHFENTGSELYTHPVSSDGDRVEFQAGGHYEQRRYVEGSLYQRQHPDRAQSPIVAGSCTDLALACTVQIDISEGSGPSGGGNFEWANADGSIVFFTDENQLTSNSTASGNQPDLYKWSSDEPEGERLTDLTASAAEPANVLGVSGAGEDGADIYFVAENTLTGAQHNSEGAVAQAGSPNLYLSHGETLTYIATLDPVADARDWTDAFSLTTRVPENGEYIAFNSVKSLTGYDNTDIATGEPDEEIFLYDAKSDALSCVSCAPDGSPPSAQARLTEPPFDVTISELNLPASMTRNVSEDGRVFFDTPNALLGQDTNEKSDVYEFHGGTLRLISPGTGAANAYFYDASPSGSNVFFITSQGLVARDTDSGFSFYDARALGGFPEPPAAPECNAEGCRGPGTPQPLELSAGTSVFSGPGNRRPKHHKHHHKKKRHKHHRGNTKGRGGR